MSEHTRGIDNRDENVEQRRTRYSHRQFGEYENGFEGMNFEQNREEYRNGQDDNERRNYPHSNDPTYRRNDEWNARHS